MVSLRNGEAQRGGGERVSVSSLFKLREWLTVDEAAQLLSQMNARWRVVERAFGECFGDTVMQVTDS